jgi:16S rRNA processing protein RimM
MISSDDLLYIGYIKRPHGFNGEVNIELSGEVALNQGDFLFIRIDGQFIPFALKTLKGKGTQHIIQLQFVDNLDYAQRLTGREIHIPMLDINSTTPLTFTGFEIIDEKLGSIGNILEILELPEQIMAVVSKGTDQYLIPMVDDFIIEVDQELKVIRMNLPEGILEQN